MNDSCFVVIICWLLLQGEFSLASGSNIIDLDEFACIVEQCIEYCSLTAKPCPDHFSELKVATDANNEMKDRIHTLETTINNSHTEIKTHIENIKDRDNQIKELKKQLKDKDEEIKHLREQEASAKNFSDRCPNGGPSSISLIKVKGMKLFPVRCHSGWIVIQSRIDGSVDFNRNWADYKIGFGDMWGEFFIGLEKLHLITAAHPQELYIELRDVNGTERYARYDNFIVGSEAEGFIIKSLGKYSGNAGDALRPHETGEFATLDRNSAGQNCVLPHNQCGKSSLNREYSKNRYSRIWKWNYLGPLG